MGGIRGIVAGAVFVLAFASAGCAGSTSNQTPDSAVPATVVPEAKQGPVYAESVDGHFGLTVALPLRIWRTGEPITGTATLSISGIDKLDIMTSSGGPFVYQLERVDGSVRGFYAGTPDLRGTTLTVASPIVGAIPPFDLFHWSSGAGSPAPSYVGPGDWTLTVEAAFVEGTAEPRAEHRLRVQATIRVTG
jgi:hypothetical protein